LVWRKSSPREKEFHLFAQLLKEAALAEKVAAG